MQKNKKLILGVAAIALAAALMIAVYFSTRPETVQGLKNFTVEVVHSDGAARTFAYNTDAEYLGKVLLSEGLIRGETGEFGLYVTTVDGEDAIYAEDGSYWALYEGEDYAMQGIDQTPIADGGEYSLVYTIG